MPQKLVFRPITKSMTAKQAEQEYLNLLKLSLHDDGSYNPDGDVDTVIIGDMLQGKPPPTKAEVLERWRQSDLRYANKTDEEMADIYADMLMRRP
jgi:hypothetical protein